MVNRVWLNHFGHGLVRTPSDFGIRGEPPTHPELLDWLALRFVNDDGWSVKKLHQLIMLSATYQQASDDAERRRAREATRRTACSGGMNRRRLDFEAMRDSLLAASGAARPDDGRPRRSTSSPQPFVPRRTVYGFIDRQNLPGMFRTFDFASPDTHSPQRFATTVPQQALFMMNSPFVIEQAKKLAARPEVADASRRDRARRDAVPHRCSAARRRRTSSSSASKFVTAEDAQPTADDRREATAWQYGYGEFDEPTQRLTNFNPLPHFTGEDLAGRPDAARPEARLGRCSTRDGGHAGNDHAHAVVRRWVAPRDVHGQRRRHDLATTPRTATASARRLVSSREGQLATLDRLQEVGRHQRSRRSRSSRATRSTSSSTRRANDVDSDSFAWPVTITKEAAAEAGRRRRHRRRRGTPSPSSPAPRRRRRTPLTPWEKYAQVLLQTNEFVFVD